MSRLQCAGNDLQESGFPAAVWSNNPCGSSACHCKSHIAQGPKLVMPLPVSARQRLLQTIAGMIVDAILLRNIFYAQGNSHGGLNCTLLEVSLSMALVFGLLVFDLS